MRALGAVAGLALLSTIVLPRVIDLAIQWPLPLRVVAAVPTLIPTGVLLGMPLSAGMRLGAAERPEIIPWGWRMNGAFSVDGATVAVFIALNWGLSATLSTAALVYGAASVALVRA